MITGLGGIGQSLLASVGTFCVWVKSELAHQPTGPQLKNMLERAFKWAKIQRDAAESMTETWIEFVPGWRRMLDAYKQDRSMPNPFEEPNTGKAPFVWAHDRLTNLLKTSCWPD